MKMFFALNILKPLILGMVVIQQLGIVNETKSFTYELLIRVSSMHLGLIL